MHSLYIRILKLLKIKPVLKRPIMVSIFGYILLVISLFYMVITFVLGVAIILGFALAAICSIVKLVNPNFADPGIWAALGAAVPAWLAVTVIAFIFYGPSKGILEMRKEGLPLIIFFFGIVIIFIALDLYKWGASLNNFIEAIIMMATLAATVYILRIHSKFKSYQDEA